MGVRFRKTIGKGPFRMTFSKSGVSVSAGVKGARISRSTSGRSRATVSIPGTGISYVKESRKSGGSGSREPRKKRRLWPVAVIAAVVVLALLAAGGGSKSDAPAAAATPTPSPTVAAAAPRATTRAQPQESAEVTPQIFTFILNTSTHKYHDPKCGSIKDIKPENKEEFTGTRDEVEALGYEPCARCGG